MSRVIADGLSKKVLAKGLTFTGDIAAPNLSGSLGAITPAPVDATTVKANNYVIDYEPLAGRTSFSDYQSGGITLTGNSSDWSIGNAYVRGAINGGTDLLYIGGGYILPKNYSGTVTYNAELQDGSFNIYFESSVDNINWVTLVTSGSNYGQDKSESYTFDGLTSATALRFRFRNGNGTGTSGNRLGNLKISDLDVAYSLIGNASGNTFKDINVAGDAIVNGGIKLGGTAAANTLDDYEEGAWTPVIGGGTCTNITGKYIKIGDQVTVTLSVLGGTLTGATTNQITGLPFTNGDTRSTTSSTAFIKSYPNDNPIGLVIADSAKVAFVYNVGNGGWLTPGFTNSNEVYLHFSATYFIN